MVTKAEMAQVLEVTCLRQGVGPEELKRFCSEARNGRFLAAVVLPGYVAQVAPVLKGSGVRVAAVIGFPSGEAKLEDKVREAAGAVKDGAVQLHLVVNHAAIKAGEFDKVAAEVQAVKKAAGEALSGAGEKPGVAAVEVVAVFETHKLAGPERVEACKAALRGGAASVQAATGAGPRGAMAGEIMALSKAVGPKVPVRAAGDISGSTAARAFLDAGASILLTEKGPQILKEVELKYF